MESIFTDLGRAIALLLVLEGIMPFLNPKGWRQMIQSISAAEDNVVRTTGLVTMLCGVALLYFL